MKYVIPFNTYMINESSDSSITEQLSKKAIESTKLKNYFEANSFLSNWIKENQGELADASGEDIVVALEPWYDEWHQDWEHAEGDEEDIELEDVETEETTQDDGEIEQESSEEELGELF